MKQVPLPGAYVIAGKEMAAMTEVLPGPFSAKAVLDEMLQNCRKSTKGDSKLVEVVDLLPREWRKQWISSLDGDRVLALCPVVCAAKKSLEVNNKKEWWPTYTNLTKIPPEQEIAPLDLAFQTYQECLVLKALSTLDESES